MVTGGAWAQKLIRTTVAGCAVALLVVMSGCSEDDEASGPVTVVSGVVQAGGGAPLSGAEVELIVIPAALGSAAPADDLASADTASLDTAGAFHLEAAPEQLTPHAGADGRVQVEIRVVGRPDASTRTTVLLRKDAETGETSVVETTGVEVLAPAS